MRTQCIEYSENIEYSESPIAVFSSSMKMVDIVPEQLVKILFPPMKCWKLLEIKVELSGEKRAAPECTWVLESTIEIPTKIYVFGARIHKLHVTKVIKNADAEQE